MNTWDGVDVAIGPTFKNDNRQQQHCYDKCAAVEKPKICQPGEVRSCSCPDPNDFAAEPLPGVKTCLADRTAFGGCDCTGQPDTEDSATEAPATPSTAAEKAPPSFEESCKAAIKSHCEAICVEKPAAERGPCEVECMRKPVESYDGTLKECTPDLAGY